MFLDESYRRILGIMEISEHPFFDRVDKEQVDALVTAAKIEHYQPDTIIFEQGSPSEGLDLVLEGEVAFCKLMDDGKSRVVGYSKAGTFFGEIGLFTEQPRALRAESRGNVVIANIPRNALLGFFKRTEGPFDSILQSIINHLNETTRHYMEDMLQQEKLSMVGTMMNTIIHDFKNPFCLISLGAQLMAQMHPDERSQKLCRNIDDQITRMVEMAEELNAFSRGDQNLQLAPIYLNRMIERFKELNFPYFQNEKITVEISLPDIVIEGEENKLLRILQNLVGNAIDAFGEDSGKITITGKVKDDDFLHLEIADNGNGIPEKIQARFFEPFVTYGKSKGTGLGTAIVRSVVTAHGGSIHFETESGQGTTFFITLPPKQTVAAS